MSSTNQLSGQRSPYLQQHAQNPFHWWPYGRQALQAAKDSDRPIFISLGYATCHWCHVMAHESFEDQATADFFNANFINIKVDREEFPDLDQYFQRACQVFHGNGGWPLSVFVTHDFRPFFIGTYFPKNPRPNMPSFVQLGQEVLRAWREDRKQVNDQAEQIHQKVMQGHQFEQKIEFPGHFPVPMAILEATKHMWDKDHGGFGEAPKFPMFTFWQWMVECALEGTISREEAQRMVLAPERMLLGGVTDHVRGGIHRYSTDKQWMVPHFEKMLYDQSGYLSMLAKFSNIYSSPLAYDAIMDTLIYLENEMLSEEGFFFCAQDADSEGQEGLYFTFTETEFEDALIASDNEELVEKKTMLKEWFQITLEGNFDNGLNIVSLNPACKEQFYNPTGWNLVRQVRQCLRVARHQRIPPASDTKGLASWNFMLISSLIEVIQYCRIDSIRQKANELLNRALPGIYKTFLQQKGDGIFSIRHTTSLDENTSLCENYIFYAHAMMRLYEITANAVFKQNLHQTLLFIRNEFSRDGKVYTRVLSSPNVGLVPNQPLSTFDMSYASPLATLALILRRGAVLLGDQQWLDFFDTFKDQLIQECLHNPLGSGQALRAMTYPQEVIRKIQVPSKWTQEVDYINVVPYFMPRFVLDYHQHEDETWQICDMSSCQMQGDGLDNFIATIAPGPRE